MHTGKSTHTKKTKERTMEMRRASVLLKSPKKEEQQVPDTNFSLVHHNHPKKLNTQTKTSIDIMDEIDAFWGIDNEDNLLSEGPCNSLHTHLNWDFMEWVGDKEEEEEQEQDEDIHKHENSTSLAYFQEESCLLMRPPNCRSNNAMKVETVGFWEEEEKRLSLNLSLNYQEVLEAWSDRGSLWADDYNLSTANQSYRGEVPVMEEERTRREARVLRYKEKRQSRLFSKKIRYQVRKLNADKRPRLKGRFVKRGS